MGRKDDERKFQEKIRDLEQKKKYLQEELNQAEWDMKKEQKRREEEVAKLNFTIHKKDFEIEELKKKKEWETEIACNKVRNEVNQQIVDAELAAAKAETALEVYKSVDNKEERKANAENFTKLIDGIVSAASSNPTINVQPLDPPF